VAGRKLVTAARVIMVVKAVIAKAGMAKAQVDTRNAITIQADIAPAKDTVNANTAAVDMVKARNAGGGIALPMRLLRGLATKRPNAGARWTNGCDRIGAVARKVIAAPTNV
jgi:hypothetical protein